MKPGGDFSPEVTAIHAVIRLEVADDGLNRVAPLEQLCLLFADQQTGKKLSVAGEANST